MHFSVCLSVKEKESMIWQVFPIFEYINSWRQILLLDWIQSVCVHHLLRTKSRHFERVNLWPSVFCNTSFFSSNSTNLQLITQTDKLIEVKWPSPNWLPSSSSSSQLVLTITPHTHTHSRIDRIKLPSRAEVWADRQKSKSTQSYKSNQFQLEVS